LNEAIKSGRAGMGIMAERNYRVERQDKIDDLEDKISVLARLDTLEEQIRALQEIQNANSL
jgi:hypothetical protein